MEEKERKKRDTKQEDRDKKHWGYESERRRNKTKLWTQYSETEFV